MWLNTNLIKADFLQRTRSYTFLIVVGLCTYLAYIFIPPIDANYTTMSIGNFKGLHNAAWVGTVSAVMGSFFLAWAGFYLVSSGIQKDIQTGLGQIIATTSIQSRAYLRSKAFSNFLVLLSAISVVLLSSMLIFIARESYPFEINEFILPFLFISVPTMFFIAHVAVIAEIIFKNRKVLQGIICYYVFALLIPLSMLPQEFMHYLNPIGTNFVLDMIKIDIFNQFNVEINKASLGFVISNKAYDFFTFSGVHWTLNFILSRVALMILSMMFLNLFSIWFHRFDIRKKAPKQKRQIQSPKQAPIQLNKMEKLPKLFLNFGLMPLIRFELFLLLNQKNRFRMLLNIGLWISMIFSPITISLNFLCPILIFLQLDLWSTLAIRDQLNRTEFIANSASSPILRVYLTRIIASFLFGIILTTPLIIHFVITYDVNSIISIAVGILSVSIMTYALSLLTHSRKLTEILFTVLTFAILQQPDQLNYLVVGTPFLTLISTVGIMLIFSRYRMFKFAV